MRQKALEQGLSPGAVQKLLDESFVAGPATNVQFMVKDSKKYASTAGWGFAQFTDGKPDGEAVLKTCFPRHAPAKDRDFVMDKYDAPVDLIVGVTRSPIPITEYPGHS